MSSILTDIDVSIDNSDVQLIVWKLWNCCIKDDYCLSLRYPVRTKSIPLTRKGTQNALKYELYRLITDRLRCIKIYDLVDVFNLSIDEIELLCKSDFVKDIPSMNWFVWKDKSPGHFSGTATYEGAIEYLKTNRASVEESVEGDDSMYITLQGEPKDGTNLRKQILCSQVIWSDKFLDDFKKYFLEKCENN